MKQYTSESQTVKLIELGFPKPKLEIETQMYNVKGQPLRAATIVGDYSIGELLEFVDEFEVVKTYDKCVAVHNCTGTHFYGKEIIDALFELCVQLKEEGVI